MHSKPEQGISDRKLEQQSGSQPSIPPQQTKSLNSDKTAIDPVRPIPPGLDPHLDKAEVIQFFKINNTLLHKKMDPESDAYDPDFPLPLYISSRKPVWPLSELVAWQEKLKTQRLLKCRHASQAFAGGRE